MDQSTNTGVVAEEVVTTTGEADVVVEETATEGTEVATEATEVAEEVAPEAEAEAPVVEAVEEATV